MRAGPAHADHRAQRDADTPTTVRRKRAPVAELERLRYPQRTLSSGRVRAAFQPPDGGAVKLRPRRAGSAITLVIRWRFAQLHWPPAGFCSRKGPFDRPPRLPVVGSTLAARTTSVRTMVRRRSHHKILVDSTEKAHVIPDDLITPDPQTLLMLEDDPVLANLLKDFLETQNFRVTWVTGGAEGVQKILNSDYAIILCDMVMPGFPGDMFYRAVERARPHLCKRFIFMTGHTADGHIDAFIRSVRGLMLWKPFQLHEILDAIKTVLRKASP